MLISMYLAVLLILKFAVVVVDCYEENLPPVLQSHCPNDERLLYSVLRYRGYRRYPPRKRYSSVYNRLSGEQWPRRNGRSSFRDMPLCEEPFISFRKSCYYMTENRMSFYKALKFCERIGSHLPVIRNTAENRFIKFSSRGRPVWIGLRKRKRYWYWINRSPSTFRYWRRYEPNGCCGPNVRCAQMSARSLRGKWADVTCERKNIVICQYDLDEKTHSGEEERVVRKLTCERGYKLFKSFCYKVGTIESALPKEAYSGETDDTVSIHHPRRRFRRCRRGMATAKNDEDETQEYLKYEKLPSQLMFSEDMIEDETEIATRPTTTVRRKKKNIRYKEQKNPETSETSNYEVVQKSQKKTSPLSASSSTMSPATYATTPFSKLSSPQQTVSGQPALVTSTTRAPPQDLSITSRSENEMPIRNVYSGRCSRESQCSRPMPLEYWRLPYYSSKRPRSYRKHLRSRYSSFEPEVYLPPPYSEILRRRTGISMIEADERCKNEAAELASICSPDENNFIRDLVKAKNSGSAWFGLRLIPGLVEMDSWYHEFTDKRVCGYRNWMFGKPDNNLSKKTEICAIISPDGEWDDYDCSDTKYIRMYVCKKPAKISKSDFVEA